MDLADMAQGVGETVSFCVSVWDQAGCPLFQVAADAYV